MTDALSEAARVVRENEEYLEEIATVEDKDFYWETPAKQYAKNDMGRHLLIESAVKQILIAIGEDPNREGLRDTPKRVARMYLSELSTGVNCDLGDVLTTSFAEAHDQLVIVKDIPFHSLCEHHMVPYTGKAHIGYIPDGKVIGLSKLARVVECASRALTIQERLTNQIADAIDESLKPLGVIVVLKNVEHMCMTMRGIKKPGSVTTTSAIRGVFFDPVKGPAARQEFFNLIA